MPFFDFDPIDPELELRGDLGPGRENRLDDRIKRASAIEKKTGGAPHAELGRYGETLARRLTGQSDGRSNRTLSPGFLGAVGAAQIRRGTDPDAVVLKDGPTRDALRNKAQGNEVRGFALLPKIARPVGPRAPNRPQDRRVLQGKLASLGHAPRVTEKPLFPPAVAADRPPVWDTNAIWEGPVPDRRSGEPRVPQASFPDFDADRGIAHGLDALLEGVRRFQLAKGLKTDGLVDPGGPTERALDAQNEKARKARLDRLETVNREIMESEAPEYAPVSDRAAADALAGLIVANEVQDQRKANLNELKRLRSEMQPTDAGSAARTASAGKTASLDNLADIFRREDFDDPRIYDALLDGPGEAAVVLAGRRNRYDWGGGSWRGTGDPFAQKGWSPRKRPAGKPKSRAKPVPDGEPAFRRKNRKAGDNSAGKETIAYKHRPVPSPSRLEGTPAGRGHAFERIAAIRQGNDARGLPPRFFAQKAERALARLPYPPKGAAQNVARGKAAVDTMISRILTGSQRPAMLRDVMHRKDIGRIAFRWGNAGDPAKNYAGGSGIAHIVAKHGPEVLPGVLRAIDQGTLRVIQNKSQRRYNIEHNGYIVSIAPSFAKDNTIQWVVTGFKRGNPKLTDNPFNIRYLKHGLFFRH